MVFIWKSYIQKYPDLSHLKTERDALKHYQKYGRSEGRTSDFPFISGEKIQLRCDYFIGTPENQIFFDSRFIDITIFLENVTFLENVRIFVFTNVLETHLTELVEFLKNCKDYILYFHNSDYPFLEEHYQVLNVPACKRIYSQNNTVKNVVTLPIGIANSRWPHGNQKILNDVISLELPKTKGIFLNFSNSAPIREQCKRDLDFLEWVPTKSYREYLETLAEYRWCICVEGNGLDTHRFWECLYLKVIPICVKNAWVETNREVFPMIVLNSWSDLRDKKLDYHFDYRIPLVDDYFM